MTVYSYHFLYKIQVLIFHGVQESMHEDDILVPVPGSAYSLANSQDSGEAAC